MSLFDFVARSTLSPLQSMLNDEVFKVNRKLQNSVDGFFAKGLKSLGLSSAITSQLSARFSDALVQGLTDEFFRTGTTAINRVARGDIIDNISPRKRADTSFDVEGRIKNRIGRIDAETSLQYPTQLGPYYAVFKFLDYTREAALKPGKLEFKRAVVLPLPRRLEEVFGIQVDSASMGGLGNAASNLKDIVTKGIAKDYSGAFESFKTGATALATPAAFNFVKGLVSKIGETVGGSEAGGLLGQELGAIPNPFLSAVFNGTELRQFSFDWRFTPRNADESLLLQRIINQFKIESLPAYASKSGKGVLDQSMLTYPSLCVMELYPWTDSSTPLIMFKPALIKSVGINYADAGVPSFFAGTKLPTFISLSIQLLETTYFTAEDFDKDFERKSNVDTIAKGAEKFATETVDTVKKDISSIGTSQ